MIIFVVWKNKKKHNTLKDSVADSYHFYTDPDPGTKRYNNRKIFKIWFKKSSYSKFCVFNKQQCCGAGRSRGFLAGAGAALKSELEPEPIFSGRLRPLFPFWDQI